MKDYAMGNYNTDAFGNYTTAQPQYIHQCDFACANTGMCQATMYKDILDKAQQLTDQEKVRASMQALWCDEGQHAFSPRDKGKLELTVKGTDEDGNEITEARTACSRHLPKFGTQNGGSTASKVQHAKDQGYDPEYVAWLEQRNQIGPGASGIVQGTLDE